MSSLRDIKELMHSCVELGYIRAQVAMSPSSDRIRKKDAERLLVSNGFKKAMLGRWVGEGLIRENRGEKNSPIWYSRMQILETIGAVRCMSVL